MAKVETGTRDAAWQCKFIHDLNEDEILCKWIFLNYTLIIDKSEDLI